MENERYDKLKRRIENIKKSFDEACIVNPEDDDIDSQQQDFIRAFILLCHAEIENYIEDLASSVLDSAKEKWRQKKIANYNIASLFLYHPKFENSKDCFTNSYIVFTEYQKVISENHGIKENNINKLFKPLGYEIADFDSMFIEELNGLGRKRGEVAHTGATVGIQQLLTYSDEKLRIDRILQGLVDFELMLESKVSTSSTI